MIKLEVRDTDALTMLRSGKLTDEVRGNLHTLILSAMGVAATVATTVRLSMNRIGDLSHKIAVIKLVRQAVTDSYPGYVLGLKEAKDFVEGYDPSPITMPESYAKDLQRAANNYGYEIGFYQTDTRGSYQRRNDPPF